MILKQVNRTRRKRIRLIPLIGLLFMILLITYVISEWIAEREPRMETLPEVVMQWRPHVLAEMARQGLSSDWIDLMMAQLMQESSGLHVDIFQCSESKYGVPGMIESEAESIEQAVYYWIKLIDRANELNLEASRENILQSYNMGIGYLDYIHFHQSNTSAELAEAFSHEVLNGGGDPHYVEHVLRYLEMAHRSSWDSQ